MRKLAAQYVICNNGPALKRGIVAADEDGTILDVEDTSGGLNESPNLEYYNGIIIPAFVNCHCHLELSHMKGMIETGGGLGGFITKIRTSRDSLSKTIHGAAQEADHSMYDNGISLCADICNTSSTFGIKTKSRIKYINLVEVFGIDPAKAGKRLEEAEKVAEMASQMNLVNYLVPHSVYSLSLPLFRQLREKTSGNNVTSIHFMETEGEKELVEKHTGKLIESYHDAGLVTEGLETAPSHSEAVLKEITLSGNLVLVHNTFSDRKTIRSVKERGRLFWCLCPGSNQYIENALPPVKLLLEEGCELVVGTDSLASNTGLDILQELITLQLNFPELTLEELVKWATLNGAKALNEEKSFGKIEAGMKPGLLLLENADLQNMKLTKESTIRRIL